MFKATSPEPAGSRSPSRAAPSQKDNRSSHAESSRRTKDVSPPVADDDEDEWVSSESGAVTPNVPLVEHGGARGSADAQPEQQQHQRHSVSPSRTPPAARQPLPPHAEPWVRTPSPADTATLNSDRPVPSRSHSDSAQISAERRGTSPDPRVHQHQHHHQHHVPHHHHPTPSHHHPPSALTRPSLMVRAASTTTPPLASPSYLTVQPLQPTLSESPPRHHAPSSPLFSPHPSASTRKGSISSNRSSATVPIMNAYTHTYNASPTDNIRPRERTMSTMSSASSAAISSLAAIPSHHLYGLPSSSSSSAPPPPTTSRFPLTDPLVDAHPLIDEPFAVEHAAISRISDPLGESFGRVARAKVASKLNQQAGHGGGR